MIHAIRYPKTESRIISLFLFFVSAVFILPVLLIKSLLFSNWKFTLKFCAISGFILAVISSGFLIFQLNSEASERYLISKYESKFKQLSKENQDLEIRFSKENAISDASDLAQKLNFEKINQINYIKLAESKVVKK